LDDASISKLGRPQQWPRLYDAEAIANVAAGKPYSIGIDYLFTENDSLPPVYSYILDQRGISNAGEILGKLSTDELLAASIADAGCVYLSLFDDDSGVFDTTDTMVLAPLRKIQLDNYNTSEFNALNCPVLPVKEFAKNAKGVGSISMPSMKDGSIRNYRLFQNLPRHGHVHGTIANFPFYMLADHLGLRDDEIKAEDGKIVLRDSLFIPIHANGSFRINWLGTNDTIRYISYYKVMQGRVPSEFFENKFVFFGSSASGLEDLKTVPSRNEKIPGVEVHAVALLNMLNNAYLREFSRTEILPVYFILGALFILLFMAVKPLPAFFISLVLVFSEMVFYVLWSLPDYNFIFPVVTLMLMTFLCYVSATLYIYFIREIKNNRLRHAFGTYVSPEVVAQIIRDPSSLHLGGQRKLLTVMFCDIRGFTNYSERMDPQEIVGLLNKYLSRMSEIILKYKGTIDKYIGDAIMAFYGAPMHLDDHAEKACESALLMVKELQDFNAERAKEGQLPLEIGIGINTGEMTVGNIGSQKRFDYTVIGDPVNVGSRIEGLTKFFGLRILVSEFTYRSCKSDRYIFREIASVIVKGREKPLVVYELITNNGTSLLMADNLDLWKDALKSFRGRQLEIALNGFKEFATKFPHDKVTHYYIGLCQKYLKHPEQYNEVVAMEHK
jgi:adenylate cyclase